MNTKHTPGPWEIVPKDEMIAPSATHLHIRDTASEFVFAKCLAVGEGEANAHLIAAAPELLEALRWVLANPDHSTGNDDHADHCAACQKVCAAIAKAEGTENG
jgi:hypothetical protein